MRDAYDAGMPSRVAQLLGVASLAAVDRLRLGVAHSSSSPQAIDETEAGALVHLQAWPGTSVNELAGVVGRSQPATVRLIDRCVDRGWVQRQAGRDRRTVALVLTERGHERVNEILSARSEVLIGMLAVLSSEEQADLERVLGNVVARLAEDRAGAIRTCRLCDRDTCMSGPGCPMEHTMAAGAPRPQPRA